MTRVNGSTETRLSRSTSPQALSEQTLLVPRSSELFSETFKMAKRSKIQAAVTRLALAMKTTADDQLLEVYADHLEEFDQDVLAEVFHYAEAQHEYFPAVAILREEAIEARRRNKNARLK